MTPPELDQLIEEGLNLYGQGDLDGALLAWEKALSVDPENAQANSYVDYVRQNYDLLTGEVESQEGVAPFAIEEEPYQIEILPGEKEHLQPASRLSLQKEELDDGWAMDDETAGDGMAGGETTQTAPAPAISLELDPALEPPPAVSFEDQTREYQSEGRPNQHPRKMSALEAFDAGLEDDTDGEAEFREPEHTPGLDSQSGFASQPTNLRERDTGFVKPAAAARTKRPSQVPAEIKMTLRTPGDDDPFGDLGLPGDPATASVALSYDDPSAAQLSPAAAELINSLPTPTPRAAIDSSRTGTAELPNALRSPASELGGTGTIAMPATMARDTTTRDFESQPTNAAMPKLSATQTREMQPSELQFGRELVSAPTRDLGIRPLGITGTATLPDEDKTAQRRAAPGVGEGTRADVILPFDPIDARSAQILDEIDEGAPDREDKEDRTRRRITMLFEKALAWAQSSELDKAVASIDLALSEDPNSALGQKLIHRHRDQMLNVFQQFLGDLDRQPVLARPLHELASAPISPRAAFLLSRIDGTLTLDELLDVSGMPRIEAYRYLCQLFLRGILR